MKGWQNLLPLMTSTDIIFLFLLSPNAISISNVLLFLEWSVLHLKRCPSRSKPLYMLIAIIIIEINQKLIYVKTMLISDKLVCAESPTRYLSKDNLYGYLIAKLDIIHLVDSISKAKDLGFFDKDFRTWKKTMKNINKFRKRVKGFRKLFFPKY